MSTTGSIGDNVFYDRIDFGDDYVLRTFELQPKQEQMLDILIEDDYYSIHIDDTERNIILTVLNDGYYDEADRIFLTEMRDLYYELRKKRV